MELHGAAELRVESEVHICIMYNNLLTYYGLKEPVIHEGL
jgi:hypothetical protein